MPGSSPFDYGLVAVDIGSVAAAVPVVASAADCTDAAEAVACEPAVAAAVVVAGGCTDYSVDSSDAD